MRFVCSTAQKKTLKSQLKSRIKAVRRKLIYKYRCWGLRKSLQIIYKSEKIIDTIIRQGWNDSWFGFRDNVFELTNTVFSRFNKKYDVHFTIKLWGADLLIFRKEYYNPSEIVMSFIWIKPFSEDNLIKFLKQPGNDLEIFDSSPWE